MSAPLLYLTYAAIALAMLLGGDFNRRGQLLRFQWRSRQCCWSLPLGPKVVKKFLNLPPRYSSSRS